MSAVHRKPRYTSAKITAHTAHVIPVDRSRLDGEVVLGPETALTGADQQDGEPDDRTEDVQRAWAR
jgi:hypothetical protein